MCTGDCFNCPYEDCISDGPLSSSERALSRQLDSEASEFMGKAKKPLEVPDLSGKVLYPQLEYYYNHLEQKRAYQRQYYYRNRSKLLAYQNRYNASKKVKTPPSP